MDNGERMDTATKHLELVKGDDKFVRKEEKTIKWLRMSKTALLVLSYCGMGMCRSMLFACIPDLRVRLDTTVEGISYAFAFGSFGAILSTPLGALADRYGQFSEVILASCLALSAVSNIGRPYTDNLWVFGICDLLDDTAWGLISNVGNSLVILMWGADGNSPLHAMHFGYPIGAAVGGQIARAFVSQNTTENTNTTTDISSNFFQWSFMSDGIEESFAEPGLQRDFPDGSSIEIGFVLISCFNLALALLFLMFQCTGKRNLKQKASKQSYKWSEILYPSKWAGGNAKFGVFIFVMGTCFQIALQGCDKGLAQYLTTYAVDSDMGFDNQEAATLSSLYYLLDAVGIFSCIFTARYLSMKVLFLIEVHGLTILAILLILFGTQSRTALYILAPAFAFFKGPAWATSYAWPDYYIVLLSALLGVTRISRNLADIAMNALQGYLYTNTVIESIFYTTLAYGVLLCVLVYIVYYITWNRPGRHQLALETQEPYEEEIAPEITGGVDTKSDVIRRQITAGCINPIGEASMWEEKELSMSDDLGSSQTMTTHL